MKKYSLTSLRQSSCTNIVIGFPFLKNSLPLLLSFLLIGSFSPLMYGQKKCLSHEIRDIQNQTNPETQQKRLILERQVEKYVREKSNAGGAAQVTIPVVFHVVHDGDAVGSNENLSDARLMSQLAQLNADFSRMNSDAGNTPTQFQGVAVNTMIQFCLATVDPNMNATTGIVRTNISSLPATSGACWTSDYIQTNIITPLVWNTANYLNIFTVDMIRDFENGQCQDVGTLGYATFPGAPANEDVAVHLASTIGSLSMPNPLGGAVGLGRTVTHEVGHWLMLNHIWGDNGGCQDDDNVADTPIQNMDNMGCPTFPLLDACTTAGNGLMFMNYMDYVDDNCMNMFTQGQATRMMAAITNSRPGLLNNSRCGMTPPTNTGYTCATAIELTAPGTFNAPGPSQGNGAIAGSGFDHANWYRFTPPMSGMIRIFTCGLAGAGNQHNHVYHINTTSCATLNLNDVAYTEDRGCTNMPTDGVKLEDVPVTAGVPIYIEWDNALSTTPFTWTLEYQTGGSTCTDYVSTDIPKTISTTAGTITSTVTVATSGTITDVNIKNLNGTHTWAEDLTFTLLSPQGTSVVLIQNICADDATGFNITLDDAATNALSCPLSGGNTQNPANVLSAFNNQNPMGVWTLSVIDRSDDDGGSLDGWTLEICTSGGAANCPPTLAVDATAIATNSYQASIQLTSVGTINAGSNVIFRAADNIELRPNFQIWPLGSLIINIAACQ